MRRFVLVAAVTVLVALGFGTQPAWAVVIHAEVGDAGDLPATAQNVTGGGPLAQITGTISPAGDEDMYRLCLSGGGTFSATTVGTPGTLLDPMLSLFDSTGAGVYFNDDDVGLDPTLPAGHPLTPAVPGVYFLAISAFFNTALDAGGNLIFDAPTATSLTGPTDADPVADWSGSDDTGTYTINITGAAAVRPCPRSFARR